MGEWIVCSLFSKKFNRTNKISNLEQLIIDRFHFAKFHMCIECTEHWCKNFCEFDLSIIIVDNNFIKRLKDTGMPIKKIRHYAELRAAGDPTLFERMEMLVQHRQTLNEQIAMLQEHKIKLDEKIEFYKKEIERVNNGFIENWTYKWQTASYELISP